MMHEIRRIASFQSACKNRRVQRELVGVWRRETRPAELAKLYDVRETFVIRLDGARGKLRGFEEEREVRVQRELRRGISISGVAMSAALDASVSTLLNFPKIGS